VWVTVVATGIGRGRTVRPQLYASPATARRPTDDDVDVPSFLR
jgi:hypothetical protein